MPSTSSFPSALDSFVNPLATNAQNAPSHSTQHTLANDALAALEAKVGITGSAVTTSLDYRIAHVESISHTHVSGETPSGSINGSNVTFTLASAPNPAAALMLFLNGMLMRPGGNDFTLTTSTIVFTFAPPAGSVLIAHYIV